MTPLALHATSEAEIIELVFANKAFDRAAIIVEKKLWSEECQVMVWTEFGEDSQEEGMTTDYFKCQASIKRLGLKRWRLVYRSFGCTEQDLLHLSKDASAEFLSSIRILLVDLHTPDLKGILV